MAGLPGPTGDDRISGEHAALRWVATLVARAVPPEEVFAAVTEEAGRLLHAGHATMVRFDPDGIRTVVGAWSSAGPTFPVGTRTRLGGRNVSTRVFQTGRPARIDDYTGASGPAAEDARKFGLRAAVGVPVSVEGRLWGIVAVGSRRAEPLPASTEHQLAGFTELAATAIANAQARVEVRGFAEEQAALRRVATLVARAAPPAHVLTAVAEEAGRLLDADYTTMVRYDLDEVRTVVGAWSSTGPTLPVGTWAKLGGRNVSTLVFQTGRAARVDDYASASGPIGELARELGFRAAVGVPVSVEGRLWGVMEVASRVGPLPAGTEARLAGFTELAATAIANAQARVEVRGFADEQAALRRVATLVARAAPPTQVLTAVTEEAGQLIGANYTMMARYDPDGVITVVAAWSSTGPTFPVGNRAKLGGRNVPTLVSQTHRPARIDDSAAASGPAADAGRELGFRAAVGVPVIVEGRLWGAMTVASRAGPLPAGTEAQLAGFTELAATAIANAQARVEVRGFAVEQAALRRVATLVARAAPPPEVLAAVAEEAGRLLHADYAMMIRYGPDDAVSVVATWNSSGPAYPVGSRWSLGERNIQTMVFQTGRPARIDDYTGAWGPVAEAVRVFEFRAAVGVPVIVEGRLWGAMTVASRAGPLPAGTEAQLAGFTELAATAIANADAQEALTASRARIVATADATRRRIERNLHDGAQQRLVCLALDLRAAEAAAPPGTGVEVQQLEPIATGLDDVLDELREIARGLHPAILTEGGLQPALKTVARRSAVPVRLDIQIEARLPEPVEIAAYYTVCEALTNATKHAHATAVEIEMAQREGVLHVRVRDDGRGGADFSHGSGLVGLKDRVEATGGHLRLHSPPGAGTTLEIDLPLTHTATRVP
ncbi:MAG TPA: GAF domain-containing protein [Streptosporangiaceae bacterium]|jgi:GAF domain-containing protein